MLNKQTSAPERSTDTVSRSQSSELSVHGHMQEKQDRELFFQNVIHIVCSWSYARESGCKALLLKCISNCLLINTNLFKLYPLI